MPVRKKLKNVNAKRAAGGFASAAKMTPQMRSERASQAAQARWAKQSLSGREVNITDILISSEISRSGAPEYILHKSEATSKDSFIACSAEIEGKSVTVTADKQWQMFNSDYTTKSPLIIVASQLRHPALIRAAYDLYVKGMEAMVTQNKTARWLTLEFVNSYRAKADLKPNMGLLVLDNAHMEMEAKKYTQLQDYIHNDSITRIVVAHGCDPLKFATQTLRHQPDMIFNVSVRAKALKSIII